MLIAFLLNQPTPCSDRMVSVRGSVRVLFYGYDVTTGFGEMRTGLTIVNFPEMSRMVRSAGTAIVLIVMRYKGKR